LSGELLSKIMAMNDVNALEQLRDQLVKEAADAELRWDLRMIIYKRIQIIVEQLMQLERE
jgi:hypothetical protein